MALEPITRQEKIIAGQDLTPITRMEKFLKEFGGSGGAQPDWNAAEGKPGHILNRPFYEDIITLFDQTVELVDADGMGMAQVEGEMPQPSDTATVTFDGVEYEVDVSDQAFIGNTGLVGQGEDNGLPFCVVSIDGITAVFGQVGTHSIKIESPKVNTLNEKFLPDMSFKVNLSGTSDALYTDRKFVEISKAYDQGKNVTLRGSVGLCTLAKISNEEIKFTGIQGVVNGETAYVNCETVTISNTDAVTRTVVMITGKNSLA